MFSFELNFAGCFFSLSISVTLAYAHIHNAVITTQRR